MISVLYSEKTNYFKIKSYSSKQKSLGEYVTWAYLILTFCIYVSPQIKQNVQMV